MPPARTPTDARVGTHAAGRSAHTRAAILFDEMLEGKWIAHCHMVFHQFGALQFLLVAQDLSPPTLTSTAVLVAITASLLLCAVCRRCL